MCKYCKKTDEGKAIWQEWRDAKKAVEAAGLNPNVAGFLQRYEAKKADTFGDPTDNNFFDDSEASVLNRYNAAQDARKEYHHETVGRLGRGEISLPQ